MLSGIAFDTETTGLSVWQGHRPFCFSTCTPLGRIEVYRLDGSAVRQVHSRKVLARLMADEHTPLIMHNAKFDLHMVRALGYPVPDGRPIHDTMIMSHLLQNHHPSHALKQLAWELCHYRRDDEQEVRRYARGRDYSVVPEHVMARYSGQDAERTMLLAHTWLPLIHSDRTLRELYSMEMDLIRTTMRMECRGLRVNKPEVRKLQSWLAVRCEEAKRELARFAGYDVMREFNPNRPAEVRQLLFEKLRLPILEYTDSARLPSTDKDSVLLPLREQTKHPAIDSLMRFRSYSRGITMLEQYVSLADANGILHPDIKTCGAITGREACSRPNLMNVSKSQALLNPFPVPARRCLGPRPGYVNYHIDYKGIEMRLLAHESGDVRMCRAFRDGEDPHELAAGWLYGDRFLQCVDKALRKDMRNAAKNANYARPYGASVGKMAETLGLPFELARVGVRTWDANVPQLARLGRQLAREAREAGYISTAFGRKLHIAPDEAYTAINYSIQGTGAELIKRAQIRVDDYLRRVTGDEWGLLLPIHDEIVVECPRTRLVDAPDVLRGIRKLMIDFPQFRVPLEIDCEVSTASWEKLKEVSIPR